MTQEGRNILRRIEYRCAQEWGVALAAMESVFGHINAMQKFSNGVAQPFGAIVWHQSWRLVQDLRLERLPRQIPRPLAKPERGEYDLPGLGD